MLLALWILGTVLPSNLRANCLKDNLMMLYVGPVVSRETGLRNSSVSGSMTSGK